MWSAIVVFAFIAYLLILFNIIVDLFWRDQQTPGWLKAVWAVFLIVFPFLTALICLIGRGGDMATRAPEAAATTKREGLENVADIRELINAGDHACQKNCWTRGRSPRPSSTR